MDEAIRFDEQLDALDESLRAEDDLHATEYLCAFDALLTRYVRGEERLLFPVLERFTSMSPTITGRMRGEHVGLRRLVDDLWTALGSHDRRRSLDVLSSLRSVLLLHVAKEEWLLQPMLRAQTSV